uniref:Uncharacterized protein n=1 Tax=Physcomitrium patens TaxID=3218 RepID=A0A2K1IQM6_PHYPA|nr:hypothetical protein PHYPA_025701 [Physcomitrium patens]
MKIISSKRHDSVEHIYDLCTCSHQSIGKPFRFLVKRHTTATSTGPGLEKKTTTGKLTTSTRFNCLDLEGLVVE